MKCTNCGGENILESGVMNSGNSKYTIYECQECYKEILKCVGLINQNKSRVLV